MSDCRVCARPVAEGEIIHACGAVVREPDRPVRPRAPEPDELLRPEHLDEPAPRAPAASAAVAEWRLRLPAGVVVPVPSDAPLVLGRTEPGDVGAGFAGCDNVSRAHAQAESRDGVLTIVDLSSTNGTFVDGRRLEPGQPATLTEGSEVRLGADRVIRVVRQPPTEGPRT